MCYEKRDPEQARACFERDQRKVEYIEREALVHHFMTTRQYLTKDLVMDAAYEVSKFPAADVVPVVHGRWIQKDSRNPFSWRTCSECGHTVTAAMSRIYKGCPVCLARMDGE